MPRSAVASADTWLAPRDVPSGACSDTPAWLVAPGYIPAPGVLRDCHPLAVAWFVPPVRVDPVDGEALLVPGGNSPRPEADEGSPCLADGDAAPPVVLPGLAVRAGASVPHARPAAVESGAGSSMTGAPGADLRPRAFGHGVPLQGGAESRLRLVGLSAPLLGGAHAGLRLVGVMGTLRHRHEGIIA